MPQVPPHLPVVLERTLWPEHHLCPHTHLSKTILSLLTDKHKQAQTGHTNAFVLCRCHLPPRLQSIAGFAPREWLPTLLQSTSRANWKNCSGGMAILGVQRPLSTSTSIVRDKSKLVPLEFPLQKLQDAGITRSLQTFAVCPPCVMSRSGMQSEREEPAILATCWW